MTYERLTDKSKSFCTFCEGIAFCRTECEHERYLERLIDLENRIESGELVEKAEVARKIFEEIEKHYRFNAVNLTYAIDIEDYTKLKKKYIPQECPQCKHFVGCECFDGKICDLYEEVSDE